MTLHVQKKEGKPSKARALKQFTTSTRRRRIISTIVVGLVLLLIVKKQIDKNKPMELPTAALEARELFEPHLVVEGQITAAQEVFLSINKGGRLDEVHVKEGSPVTAGQVLMVVDAASRRAGLGNALSGFNLAREDVRRFETLYQVGSATLQDVDDAKSKREAKRADLETAKKTLEDGIIRSPIAGVVAFVAYSRGDVVADGARLAVVEDRSEYKITGRAPADRKSAIVTQGKITLLPTTGDAPAVVADGRLVVGDGKSDFDGLDIDVTAFVKELPTWTKVGQRVSVSLPLTTYPKATLITRDAISWKAGQPRLLVVKDGKADWLPAKIGIGEGNVVPLLTPLDGVTVINVSQVPQPDKLMASKKKIVLVDPGAKVTKKVGM